MAVPRSRARTNLARFEALDPATLSAEQRKFRDFAIRALKIELELQANGLVGADGAKPTSPAPTKRGTRKPR